MKRIAIAAIVCLLAVSCDPLAREEMTLTFDDSGETVRVKVASDKNHIDTYHAGEGNRLGEDVLAERDEWSARFAAADARDERIIIGRSAHKVTSVEEEATVDTADLQRLFFDVGVTVQVIRGEGWAELTMFAGASNRATNRQRDAVQRKLEDYARLGARYFTAVRDLYDFLDANPGRAEEMFFGVYTDKREEALLSEKERPYVDAVRRAAEALSDAGDDNQRELERTADLVFNPFPAAVAVRVPSEPLVVEGFERQKDGSLVAGTATPFQAIVNLEGRWVSPDPIAELMRSEGLGARDLAARIAAKPRKAERMVNASEIVDAIVKGIQPAPRYRVRWITKARSGAS
ncbi:MAG TPA: hypothetical protein VLV78_22000 [Thermoanaerobaculia bacterium]|nr:hypothetical protein [Thermoanaerobaculia bacterium]